MRPALLFVLDWSDNEGLSAVFDVMLAPYLIKEEER